MASFDRILYELRDEIPNLLGECCSVQARHLQISEYEIELRGTAHQCERFLAVDSFYNFEARCSQTISDCLRGPARQQPELK
jgi:hypothetical protein